MAEPPSPASDNPRLSHHARSGRHMWNECAGGFRLPARCVSRVANHRLIYCRIHCWRLVCHTGCLAGTQAAKDRRPVSDDLVALGAATVRAWTEGATLLFLFSLSNTLEQFANHRTKKTIESLLKSAPQRALRREGQSWIEVPIDEIRPGDELLVKPGELFPVDGVMIEGATSADESALTGESQPVPKGVGDSVSSGTLNLDGQAVIRASREEQQSALQRILSLIQTAQQQKAPAQRFTDSFSRYYTWVALSLSALLFVILLAIHKPLADAFYRTHDFARGRVALRAGLVDSICDSGRDCRRSA